MGPLGRFFLSLLAVWLIAWLPIGLYLGEADYVLRAVSRGSAEREIYQGILYLGLLLVFVRFWRRHAPVRPGLGSVSDLTLYAGLGLGSALGLRVVLTMLGARDWPPWQSSWSELVIALLSALVVALVEEAVFRGFLLGSLARTLGFKTALLLSSLIFAVVHLFRPGPLGFKAAYGLGLFLLALMLARIAWEKSSIAASAGFHAGIILPNLLDPWTGLATNWWAGWQSEPVSGVVAWLTTLALWAQWEWWRRSRTPSAGVADERDTTESL